MPMKIEEQLKSKRQEILAIAAKHGARNLRVFGSVARGEARPESDLDILVEIEPERSLMDHVDLMHDLKELMIIV
jgi:predicted nucleotidyltransferase